MMPRGYGKVPILFHMQITHCTHHHLALWKQEKPEALTVFDRAFQVFSPQKVHETTSEYTGSFKKKKLRCCHHSTSLC